MSNLHRPPRGNRHAELDEPGDPFAFAAATGTYASTRREANQTCQPHADSRLPRAHRLPCRRRRSARVVVLRSMVIHDQARAPLPRHVGPDPLQKDTHPKAGLPDEFEAARRTPAAALMMARASSRLRST